MQKISSVELNDFKKKIYKISGFNLEAYKNCQLDRRLLLMMEKANCTNLYNYYSYLSNKPDQLNEFIDSLTINVSEFFRNSDKFQELRQKILPEISRKKRTIRIWSAGCSNGAEVYSVLIILAQMKLLERSYIIATDIDTSAISKAKKGIYYQDSLQNVTKIDLEQYFDLTKDDDNKLCYQFKESWSKHVHFYQHDLLSDEYPRYIDLLICRNVIIYFNDDAKKTTYNNFYRSLREDGILFIGGTERISNYLEMGFDMLSPFFYQKCKKQKTLKKSLNSFDKV